MEFLVGEMKAKLDQLLSNNVTTEQHQALTEKVESMQNWTYDQLVEMIREIANPPQIEQVEEIAEEVAEQVDEQIEEILEVVEEVEEQTEDIPIVPIQVEQDEPIQAQAKKRPWWL
jgi:dihydroneopterin aldolase